MVSLLESLFSDGGDGQGLSFLPEDPDIYQPTEEFEDAG